MPTVVDASTIAGTAMDALVESFRKGTGSEALAYSLQNLDWQQRQMMVREVLEPYAGGRLMVTPKDIDTFIEDIALIIGAGLNAALHPKVHSADSGKFLQ